MPAISTVHAVLDRHGLVKRRKRRRNRATGTPLSTRSEPNELWCADYKGEFMLADRRYCYPLTITDFASRYLIACEALSTTKEAYAFTVFERAFKEFGLPKAIRTDNGVPFASPNALFNLSKLSVWWLRLGIDIERIKPGNPQQNGRHERMHLTLKKEATKPAARTSCSSRPSSTTSSSCYNNERPHQALDMNLPGRALLRPQPRPYRGLPDARLPVPRQGSHRHHLRPHLLQSQEDQSQPGLRRPDRRHQRGRRPHLARQLHALRSGLLRRRDMPTRAARKPFRAESVTYVSGINRYLCVRNGP